MLMTNNFKVYYKPDLADFQKRLGSRKLAGVGFVSPLRVCAVVTVEKRVEEKQTLDDVGRPVAVDLIVQITVVG